VGIYAPSSSDEKPRAAEPLEQLRARHVPRRGGDRLRCPALVLRGNGTFEVWLPHVHTDPPPNAVAMAALMCAYHDKRIMEVIKEAMDAAGYEYLDPPPSSLTPAGERPDRH